MSCRYSDRTSMWPINLVEVKTLREERSKLILILRRIAEHQKEYHQWDDG